jgi:hypothetical protein
MKKGLSDGLLLLALVLSSATSPVEKPTPTPPAKPPVPVATPVVEQAGSLCLTEEEIKFSCKTNNGKLISLCASRDLSATAGGIQYRFGRPGQVELGFPQDARTGRTVLSWDLQSHVDSQSYHVRFENGGYSYDLYDQDTLGSAQNHGSGVLVEKPGTPVISIGCVGETVLKLDTLQGVLPGTK